MQSKDNYAAVNKLT